MGELSAKFLKHMIALLELDVQALECQAVEGLELASEMLPLVEEEIGNYREKLKLLTGEEY